MYLPEPGSLSQQLERFARAQMRNADQIGRHLGLDPRIVAEKRINILHETGRKAFSFRDLPVARRLLGQAFREAPSMGHAAWWLATFIPAWLLDLRSSAARLLKTVIA